MSEQVNQSVLDMIDRLHARLDDLAYVVKEIPYELPDYDKKLDKIDDKIYLLEVEIEKKKKNTIPLKALSEEQAESFDAATKEGSIKTTKTANKIEPEDDSEEDETEGFLTDSAKETLAGATKTLNNIYKEGKEVAGEFSEAFGDLKDVLPKKRFFR